MDASLYVLTVSTNAGSTRAKTGPIGVTAGPISDLPFRSYRYHLGASSPASTYLGGGSNGSSTDAHTRARDFSPISRRR
jgi:hypothetical protein